MKTATTALLLAFGLLAVAPTHAATNDALVNMYATFIEYPANMTVTKEDWQSGELEKRAGVTVLRLPMITTRSGSAAYLRATNSQAIVVPFPRKESGATFWTQPEFHIAPTLDGDTVRFTAVTSVRESRGSQDGTDGEVSEFLSRHYHFVGAPRVGEWAFYAPKGVHNNRSVCLAVRITRF